MSFNSKFFPWLIIWLAGFNLLVLHMIWFSGVWSMHRVKQFVVLHSEENRANPPPSTGEINLYVVVLQGQWIERNHCMIDNRCGIVTLRPVPGAHCSVNGCEVSGSCRLSQGKACFCWECCIIVTLSLEFRSRIYGTWADQGKTSLSLLPAPQGLIHG